MSEPRTEVRIVTEGQVQRGPQGEIQRIHCVCSRVIYDGQVIRARVIDPHRGEAKCKHCRRWVQVPVRVVDLRGVPA